MKNKLITMKKKLIKMKNKLTKTKKNIIIVPSLILLVLLSAYLFYDYSVYYSGRLHKVPEGEVQSFTRVKDEKLWLDSGQGKGFEVFDLKGVNLGLGKPGTVEHTAVEADKTSEKTDNHAITKEEYLRWFEQIQELGANTIRTYRVANEDFYKAFYEYNTENPEPLYLIHGVEFDDYLLNSHRDVFDEEFLDAIQAQCKDVVDIIHGRHKSLDLKALSIKSYKKDISPWVYGYSINADWDGDLVVFTNEMNPEIKSFKGDYLRTKKADKFEVFLAMVGEEMISYETAKYKEQRSLAFENQPTTDPFKYPEKTSVQFEKFDRVDVDRIKAKKDFIGGHYASYNICPSYPELMHYLNIAEPEEEDLGVDAEIEAEIDSEIKEEAVTDIEEEAEIEIKMEKEQEKKEKTTEKLAEIETEEVENSYLAYLEKLNKHHKLPVVISEFGIPSSRGMVSYEQNQELGRDAGMMSEKEQGKALVSLYEDIEKSGCAGALVLSWQDDWTGRSFNTDPYVDLAGAPYWCDYQSHAQSYGLLSFDPGKNKSICYVDGDKSDWSADDLVTENEDYRLSMKYDEKFVYFLAEKEDLDPEKDKIYLPIDLTPKTGSKYMENRELETSHPTDFVIEIDSRDNSRIWVQEAYNAERAIFDIHSFYPANPFRSKPDKDSPKFNKMRLILKEDDFFNNGEPISFEEFSFSGELSHYRWSESYETGLLSYGNANPSDSKFNSLADFSFGEDFVEIKIPWGLLNFSDPTQMKIHDDYYEVYGVENLEIDHLNVGIGDSSKQIKMLPFKLEKMGKNPKYHERLKDSYYILQEKWAVDIFRPQIYN